MKALTANLSASKHKLKFAIIDYNKLQSYGETREVLDLEPLYKKWESLVFLLKRLMDII